MLKTTFTINCDECGKCYENLLIALEPHQHVEALRLIQVLVQEDGWHVCRQNHRCPDCVLEATAVSPACS